MFVTMATAGTSFASPSNTANSQQHHANGVQFQHPPLSSPPPASKPYAPNLEWIRLSRTLHLELVEECRSKARPKEVARMLGVLQKAGDNKMNETELTEQVKRWKQGDKVFQRPSSSYSSTPPQPPSAVTTVSIGKFRKMLLQRGDGVTDLALMCGLLERENNRVLLESCLDQKTGQQKDPREDGSITRQWLSLVENIFIVLDTAGHGVLTFLEMNKLALH